MSMRWWQATINCTECQTEAELKSAGFSADGELSYSFVCPKCHEILQWRIFATALAYKALENDTREDKLERRHRPPLTPPLAELPSPPPTLTDEDKKWERDLHIDPEDGRLE